MRLRAFGLPGRHSGNLKAKSDTADDTSYSHLSDVPGACLQDASNEHESHAEEHGGSSPKAITEIETR